MSDGTQLYRSTGVALLRAAVTPLGEIPTRWPDPDEVPDCVAWLRQTWSRPGLAAGITAAGPTLARRVEALIAGTDGGDPKRVRRATAAVVRYVLRSAGRPTPFGLFAGVAPLTVGSHTRVDWGAEHRPMARVDTEWLADLVDRLEACPQLLARVDVVFSRPVTERGDRLELANGPFRVSVRRTRAVLAAREAAASPVRFGTLVDAVAEAFPRVDRARIEALSADLVRRGFLISALRAPMTVTDPLARLVDELRRVHADTVPAVAPLVAGLRLVAEGVRGHNEASLADRAALRADLGARMRTLSDAGRTALGVDTRLDCRVAVPHAVAWEMERAASALLRTTRRPAGESAWRAYHAAFVDRYGVGAAVPLADVVDPDTGLGYPAGYPTATEVAPAETATPRDDRLLAMAWEAMADGVGVGEVVLTDADIRTLADGTGFDERRTPPHLELSARVHAHSVRALDRGEFTLVVAPAGAAGTITSRFTPTATGSGLEDVYRTLPPTTEGALRAQLATPPLYAHAQNVGRVPGYLPHVLSLGEHRGPDDSHIAVDVRDLAVLATSTGLHLVDRSRHVVVEPQVFHALALHRQVSPLARFVARLPRALGAQWYEFDWGPRAQLLPWLPRVRYGRSVLSPARWRLTGDDLPAASADGNSWRLALRVWRTRWKCPDTVELRDATDRTLRLSLDEPAHAELLRGHLAKRGHAIVHEAASAAEFGWIGGHVHEIALPLAARRPPAPSPLIGLPGRAADPVCGAAPGSASEEWVYAKIHAHPERFDEIIAHRLPELAVALDRDRARWFVRHRGTHERDHLRLYVHTPDPHDRAAVMAAIERWTRELRAGRAASHLVLDTYRPEVGRYGAGAAMAAAERVFAADSRTVAAWLAHAPTMDLAPLAWAALSMVGIACAFHGDPGEGMRRLAAQPIGAAPRVERAIADTVPARITADGVHPTGLPAELSAAWAARAQALAAYRELLPADTDTDAILDALLCLHHNRALGIDPTGERTCRRLARQAVLAFRAHPVGP
ncbi:lantibiotic dehydratase [Embleya sp. NPDC056575]|uniref:lantibiotic dehydratase n=1 Tax=unclassified Embleya TaxID=2699296 RepID=UPI0036BEC3D6